MWAFTLCSLFSVTVAPAISTAQCNSGRYATSRIPSSESLLLLTVMPFCAPWFGIATNLAFRDNPYGQEVRGAPSSGWGFHPRSGMYLLNVYSIFKVREVFALTNQLGIFFRFVRSFFEIFQKNFFDHLSGTKKAPITSQRCNRGRNRKSPLIEISGLKSYEIIVCYWNLSAIAKFQTHFWRKLGVNWRKLWRKHRQFRVNQ